MFTSVPSGPSHLVISQWQSRIGAERKVRRVLPESSLKRASFWHLAMTSAARFVMSPVRNGF
jgi:hypothetical protein